MQKHAEDLKKDIEAHLEKSAHQAREKSAHEVSEHIRKTAAGVADELLVSSSKDFHKQAGEIKAAVGEDIKATVKSQAEDAKKRLTALTHATVESLNKEGNAGLDVFRKHLHQTLKDFQDKETKNLEKHLEATVENLRGEIQKKLQSAMDQQLADAATQMSKQSDANLTAISAQLNEKKQQMVNEAEEAFRTKLAEVFASVLQPGARKAT
jgi:hypothetical protein